MTSLHRLYMRRPMASLHHARYCFIDTFPSLHLSLTALSLSLSFTHSRLCVGCLGHVLRSMSASGSNSSNSGSGSKLLRKRRAPKSTPSTAIFSDDDEASASDSSHTSKRRRRDQDDEYDEDFEQALRRNEFYNADDGDDDESNDDDDDDDMTHIRAASLQVKKPQLSSLSFVASGVAAAAMTHSITNVCKQYW
jgi:hypothetical protein